MKRFINGRVYDTETSVKVALHEFDNRPEEDVTGVLTLYMTPGGAFFLHDCRTTPVGVENESMGLATQVVHDVQPLTRDEAHEWIMTGNVEVFSDVLGEPPEASEEAIPGATLYVRVSETLKQQIEAKIQVGDISLNDWIVDALKEKVGKV